MVFYRIFYLVILNVFQISVAVIQMTPRVRISDGELVGESGLSFIQKEFYKFWCIPYAKQRRFEPSEPADPWENTLDATSCGTSCPQTAIIEGMGDMMAGFGTTEDCLILNVFVPKVVTDPTSEIPVMVFIHGGYFVLGSSVGYSGEMLLDEQIILVTINYRLGALGFLTTNDGEIEANLGLKDMILALKWIQKNIQNFGGDPNRVTIFGESAGAGAVQLLILSPMAKGLFHNAISQSGGSLAPWSYQSRPEEVFQEFVKKINCSAATTKESVACLKSKTAEEISETQSTKWFIEMLYPTFPAVETFPPKNSEIFLPDHPLKLLKEGRFNRVPYIQGVCEDEGAYQGGFSLNDAELRESLNSKWIPMAGIALGVDTRNISTPRLNAGLRKLRRFYFDHEDIGPQHIYTMVDMFSDAWFINSLGMSIKYYSKHAPIYPYIFAKKGELHPSNFFGFFDRPMTSHGDDLFYLFYKFSSSSDSSKKFIHDFVKLWISFAYTGKPSATWGSAKTWPFVKADSDGLNYPFYRIDEDAKLMDNPYKERMLFWRDLAENEWNEFAQ